MNALLIISLDSGLPLFTRLCSPILSKPDGVNQSEDNGKNVDIMQIASLLFALRKLSSTFPCEETTHSRFELFQRGSENIFSIDQQVATDHILTAVVFDSGYCSSEFGRIILNCITENMIGLLPLLKDSTQPRQLREKIDNILTNIALESVKTLISKFQESSLSIKLISTLTEIDLNGPKFQGRTGINVTPAKQGPSSPSLFRTPADTVSAQTLDRQHPSSDTTNEVAVKSSRGIGICCCIPSLTRPKENNVVKTGPIQTSPPDVLPHQPTFQTPSRSLKGSNIEIPPSTGKRTDTRYEVDILVLFFDSYLNQRFKEDLYHASISFCQSIGHFALELPVQKEWFGDCLTIPVDYDGISRKFQPRCLPQLIPLTNHVASGELEIVSIEDGSPVKQQSMEVMEIRNDVAQKSLELCIIHKMCCLLEWKADAASRVALFFELRDIVLYILWCYSQKLAIPGFCYARDLD